MQYPLELSASGMLLEELEILANQAVREAGGDADLIDGEALFLKQHDTGKVLDITFDGCLRVSCSAFDPAR